MLARRLALLSGASPLYQLLFGNGENGFLFGNFSEPDELFQTAAGLTAVASDSDPVGVALDDHGWGPSSYAAIAAAATELFPDGGMSDASTGWTYSNASGSIVSGALRLTSTAVGAAARTGYKTLAGLTVGVSYRATVDVVGTGGTAGGAATIRLQALTTAGAAVQDSEIATGAGTRSLIFTATATSHRIQARFDGSGGDATTYVDFDNLSVKAISGNHGYQTTGGSRPLWRSNGGRPYLQFDGTDDCLVTGMTSSGLSGVTLIAKFTVGASGAVRSVVGGGTGDRLRLSVDSSGQLAAGIGGHGEATIFRSGSLVGQTGVGAVTADGSTVKLYWNGVQAYSAAQLATFVTTVPIAVGAYNNTGTPGVFFNSNIYAAAAVSRVLSAAEIMTVSNTWGTSA